MAVRLFTLALLMGSWVARGEDGNPIISEVPMVFIIGSPQFTGELPNLRSVRITWSLEPFGSSVPIAQKAIDIPFGAVPSPGEHIFVKAGKPLTNISNAENRLYWDGKCEEKDGSTRICAPGDHITVQVTIVRTGNLPPKPDEAKAFTIDYELRLPIIAVIQNDGEVKWPAPVDLIGPRPIIFRTEFSNKMKHKQDAQYNGFYIYPLDANGHLIPGSRAYIQGEFTTNTASPTVMRAGRAWTPTTSGITRYRVFPVVSIASYMNEALRVAFNATNRVGMLISVTSPQALEIILKQEPIQPYGPNIDVLVGVAADKRAAAALPIYGGVRQFPEYVKVSIKVVTKNDPEQKPFPYSGTIVMSDIGGAALDPRLPGNAPTRIFGNPSIFFAGPDAGGDQLRMDSPPSWEVPVDAGIGVVTLMWVAPGALRPARAKLVARFPTEKEGAQNQQQAVEFSSCADEIGCGGTGHELNGNIRLVSNSVYDWGDIMLKTTSSMIAGPETDARLTLTKVGEYLADPMQDAIMWVKASHSNLSNLNVNQLARNIRPARNYTPMCRGRKFARSISPFLNALVHESRHAYINFLTNKPENDPDNDYLPTRIGKAVNDPTAPVEFPFPWPNGDARSTIQDPHPRVSDQAPGGSGGNVPAGSAANVPMFLVENVLPSAPPQPAKPTPVTASWLYGVQPGSRLDMLYSRQYEPQFTLTLGGRKQTFALPYGQKGTTAPLTGTKTGQIEIVAVEPHQGQAKFAVTFMWFVDDLAMVQRIMAGALPTASYSYVHNNDNISRMEMDAYSFAETQEPKVAQGNKP